MVMLLIGLLLFLGLHSLRIVADGWRMRTIARVGEGPWKGVYSVVSVLGFVLIVWGYGIARQQPVVLWPTPTWGRHAAALLTLLAFIGLAAAYVPANAIKVGVGHPMVLAALLWSLGHLLANSTVADAVLFGSFGVWALLDYSAARKRDREQGVRRGPARGVPTLVTVGVGIVAWAVFAFWAHDALIGVRPFG